MANNQYSKKLGFVGFGIVGRAVSRGFANLMTFTASIYDPALEHNDFSGIIKTDFVFICTPTEINADTIETATVSAETVFEVLNRLVENRYEGIAIIKSTLPLECISRLAEYSEKLHIVVNPEFLTERNAARDFIDATQIVIGTTNNEVRAAVVELYEHSYLRKHWFIHLTPAEAIAYKLMINAFLATKVSLINEFREILGTVSEITWNDFVHHLSQDPRFGLTHNQSPGHDGQLGYGGKCLPACVNSLASYSRKQMLLHHTLEGGIDTNQFLRIV
jgi:nucleotide sugar dehydrogenase